MLTVIPYPDYIDGMPVEELQNHVQSRSSSKAAAVKAAFPKERLLVHSAKDGWAPLCAHLGVPVPETPYPRTNNREEFFELMKGADDM